MTTPATLLLCFYCLNEGVRLHAFTVGKLDDDSFRAGLLGRAVTLSLLWWGGFFQ